jgi:hypothetical protein
MFILNVKGEFRVYACARLFFYVYKLQSYSVPLYDGFVKEINEI